MNLWGFLSICVVFGVSFVMLIFYLNHEKELKKMELEALQKKDEQQ